MSEHKFEIGDRVFILLRDRDRDEDSRFHGVSRSSLGVVVQVRDLENTPFIYKVEISGDVFNHLHEKQMILVSDFDSFRERQFMHHNNAEWEPEELYRYSMIV